jgi:acetolactate synthase-1/2/3 large subunit
LTDGDAIDGGTLAARTLRALGVDAIFTLCGGHIMPLYCACPLEGVRVVDVRHEQAAVHAAEAWGRVRRSAGVAVVTAGPGVTGAVTGVASAFKAGSPLVVIGGARPLAQDGQGALQELAQPDLFASITKWRAVCRDTARIGEYVAAAYRQATSHPRGPVYLELPMDVLFGTVPPGEVEQQGAGAPAKARAFGDPREVERAAALLDRCERPVVIAGSGVYWDAGEAPLRELVERADLPLFVNGMARGLLPADHRLAFAHARRRALAEADLAVVIGTPLDFRLGFGRPPAWRRDTQLVHVMADPAEIGRNRTPEVGIAGDTAAIAVALGEAVAPTHDASRLAWIGRLRAAEDEAKAPFAAQAASDAAPIDHYRLAADLDRALPAGAYVVGDGGDVVAAASRVVRVAAAGRWLDPGPLGCLGIGIPFALGVLTADPGATVCVVQGDGAFGLNGFEFETMTRLGLPVVVVVGNDAAWGEIRNPQRTLYPDRGDLATLLAPSRYDRLVEAFGGRGEHVERPEHLLPALERAFASRAPALVNVALDRDAMAGHAYRGM